MISAFKRIFKNTLWLSIAEVVDKGLLFIFIVLLARYLGAADYGKFGFAVNFVTLFSILAGFGLTTFITREIAKFKNKTKKYLDNLFLLKIFTSVTAIIAIFVIIQFLNKDNEVNKLVYLLAFYIVAVKFNEFFHGVFRAYEKMEYEALAKFIQTAIVVILGVTLIYLDLGLIYFGWAYALGTFIGSIFCFFTVRYKFCKFGIQYDKTFWRYSLKEAWPFALSIALVGIYYYLDTVILSIIKTDEEVGWYNAVYKPIIFLIAFRSLLMGSVYPSFVKYYPNNNDKIKKIFSVIENITIMVGVPLVIGGIVLGENIVTLLYGNEYIGGVVAFKILLLGIAVIYINAVYPGFLNAIGKQRLYMKIIFAGAVLNIILDIILIPTYSLNGAAIATLGSELIVFVFAYYFTNKIIKVKILRFFIKPIFASLVMLIILLMLFEHLHVLLLIFIGFLSYILTMVLIKGIKKKDISTIKSLFLPKTSTK